MRMEMKIRFQLHALNEALDVASIVPPRPLTPDGGAGFLFVARNKECFIYSRDQKHQMRVSVPVEEADDGSFIFPAEKVGALKYLDGWVEIEAGKDDSGDRFWVKYEAESKNNKAEDLSTIDPRMMQSLDDALQASSEGVEFPASLLREALNTTKPYLAKPNDSRVEEHFQTLQVFDLSREEWKKGNGFMFAADGIRTCYFYCDKFQGKGLALHAQHLPFLTPFLAKCTGNVKLRHGKGMTFLVNSHGQVLGWAHNVHEHGKFSYYPHKSEHFILRADKDLFVKAMKHTRALLDAKRDKIRIQYSHEERTLTILASDASAKAVGRVMVEPVEEEGGGGKKGATDSFAVNANLNHLIELIEPLRSPRVELRVAIVPPANGRKEAALFRTVDTFILDEDGRQLIAKQDTEEGKAAECQVTRFMPSRE